MRQITIRKLTAIVAAIFSIFFYSCNEKSIDSIAESVRPPNIIYILADDLGYGDLGCYGQQLFQTPNMDRLAASGMMFSQHYSGSTVCAPSRSTIMTGMHTGHTFIRGNKEVKPEGQYPLPDSIVTLPELLKSAGYATGAFGKWGLGYPGSEGDPANQGFDSFFGYNCQRFAHHYYPRHLWDNHQKIAIDENTGFKKGAYAPDLIQDKALEFIDANRSQPFFLFVPHVIPHAELIAPDSIMQKHIGQYLPEKNYKGYDTGEDYRKGPYESQPEAHAAFVAMIEILDKNVGQIVDRVNDLGLGDNTIIIFSSDNGPHMEGGADPDYFDSNGPLRGYKRDLYEGGIRVPLIVQWSGHITAGSRSDHVSAFWDLMPTFLEMAGVKELPSGDGISFLPTLLGHGHQKEHEYLFWEFTERGGRIAIRKDDWKAVKYGFYNKPNAAFELYNLKDDIAESRNVAQQNPEVVQQMESIFEEAHVESPIFPLITRAAY